MRNWLTPRRRMRPLHTDYDLLRSFFDEIEPLSMSPACDLEETDSHFIITVELPGVRREDIKLQAVGNLITISGERNREPAKRSQTQPMERFWGQFSRSFSLPYDTDADKITANYENGILTILVPKSENAKIKQIPIGSEKGLIEKITEKITGKEENEGAA